MERLEVMKKELYRCIHCKACKFTYSGDPSREGVGEHKGVLYEGMVPSCPSGLEYGWESYWNAGRMWITRCIMEGDLEFSENVRDTIMQCITCGMCEVQCENKVPCVDIIESLRAACYFSGVPLIEKHELVSKIVVEKNNPYGGDKDKRFEWVKENELEEYLDKKGAKIAYYVGCTASYRQINIAVATCKIFKKLGIDFALVTKEVCCGSPFFRIGRTDISQDLMNTNLELFKKYEMVLFSCAGCYRTFTVDYPKWIKKELPFKTNHAFELISDMVKDGKIKFKENPELKGKVVTYHDPCHTGRHFYIDAQRKIIDESKNLIFDLRKLNKWKEEWFEKPRIIIRALPGVKFNEMYRIHENSFCCGAGGGVRAGYPDFSLKTSSLRLDEAEAVGADFMLTECPFCWRNLDDANTMYNHGIPVYGILELIDKYDLIAD